MTCLAGEGEANADAVPGHRFPGRRMKRWGRRGACHLWIYREVGAEPAVMVRYEWKGGCDVNNVH